MAVICGTNRQHFGLHVSRVECKQVTDSRSRRVILTAGSAIVVDVVRGRCAALAVGEPRQRHEGARRAGLADAAPGVLLVGPRAAQLQLALAVEAHSSADHCSSSLRPSQML